MMALMRNLIFVAAMLLVSASGSLCGKNPVEVLNNYLVDNVKSGDFVENRNELNNWLKNDQRDTEADHLAGLILKVHPTDLCSDSNLKALRDTAEAVYGYDKKSFTKTKTNRRLNKLLVNYIDKAWKDCVIELYEPRWVQNFEQPANFIERDLDPQTYWFKVDQFNKENTSYFSMGFGDFDSFRGAVRLLQGKFKPAQYLIRSLIRDIHKGMTKSKVLKMNEKTGKEERLTVDEAKEYLTRYLYLPCKSLFDHTSAQTILGPVTDLAMAMVLKTKSTERYENLDTLQWAARNLFCKWISGKHIHRLAKLVAV